MYFLLITDYYLMSRFFFLSSVSGYLFGFADGHKQNKLVTCDISRKKKAGSPLYPYLHLKALVFICFVTKKHNWSLVCSKPEKCQVKLYVQSFKTWKYGSGFGEKACFPVIIFACSCIDQIFKKNSCIEFLRQQCFRRFFLYGETINI